MNQLAKYLYECAFVGAQIKQQGMDIYISDFQDKTNNRELKPFSELLIQLPFGWIEYAEIVQG